MKKLIWLVVLLILVGGVAVWAIDRAKTAQAKTGDAKQGGNAIAVVVTAPERTAMRDSRIFTGTLKPWSLFEVAAKVGGRLEQVNFDIGDRIRGGEVIATIDDTEFRQAVDETEADLEVAEAQQAEALVRWEQSHREYERQKSLNEKQVGSVAQLEEAETNYRAQEASARKADAEVKRRKAILAQARTKLADCTVTAPWSPEAAPRFVGVRSVDQGALIAPNESILSVGELDRLLAVIYVIERDYPYIKLEQPAKIHTDAYPGEVFDGKVVRVAQLLQDSTRQAAVQIEVPNADFRLKPGMYVRVELEFASRADAQILPRNALVKRNGVVGVFELTPDRQAVRFVQVQTGIQESDRVEIIAPELTRPVVTMGNHLLTDGVEVLVPAMRNSMESAQ